MNLENLIKGLAELIKVLAIIAFTIMAVNGPSKGSLLLLVIAIILSGAYLAAYIATTDGNLNVLGDACNNAWKRAKGVKLVNLQREFSPKEREELLSKNNISEEGESKNGRRFSGIAKIYELKDIVPYCEPGSTVYYYKQGECTTHNDPGFLYHLMVIDADNNVATAKALFTRQKFFQDIQEMKIREAEESAKEKSRLGTGC